MAAKTSKPPGLASHGGSFTTDAVREDNAPPAYFQVEFDARRAVLDMTSNGAHFTVTRRDDGRPDFLWDLPKGGNRSACRKIISEAKQNSATYWHAFVAAIVENAGGPAQ